MTDSVWRCWFNRKRKESQTFWYAQLNVTTMPVYTRLTKQIQVEYHKTRPNSRIAVCAALLRSLPTRHFSCAPSLPVCLLLAARFRFSYSVSHSILAAAFSRRVLLTVCIVCMRVLFKVHINSSSTQFGYSSAVAWMCCSIVVVQRTDACGGFEERTSEWDWSCGFVHVSRMYNVKLTTFLLCIAALIVWVRGNAASKRERHQCDVIAYERRTVPHVIQQYIGTQR